MKNSSSIPPRVYRETFRGIVANLLASDIVINKEI